MVIIEDKRKIKSIHLAEEGIFVGGEVGEIVAYNENGEMAAVVWFAIYSNGEIIRRVNGKFVESVVYSKHSLISNHADMPRYGS